MRAGRAILSISYNRLGEVRVTQGNLPEALGLFRDALAIRERLAKGGPWQRAVDGASGPPDKRFSANDRAGGTPLEAGGARARIGSPPNGGAHVRTRARPSRATMHCMA